MNTQTFNDEIQRLKKDALVLIKKNLNPQYHNFVEKFVSTLDEFMIKNNRYWPEELKDLNNTYLGQFSIKNEKSGIGL